jgi:dCTP deaminase
MRLLDDGVINAKPEQVNGASIDVTLDEMILVEKEQVIDRTVDLSIKRFPEMLPLKMSENGYAMPPGQFILASTRETFNLPNTISAMFKLKSSIARGGLNHLLAGYADPGWKNSKLTLELHNCLQYNTLILKPGMKIGQMIFYRVNEVPEENSYAVKGRYNHTTEVTASKGV